MATIRAGFRGTVILSALVGSGMMASAQTQSPFFSETRLGLGLHDPWSPERGSADLRALVLFRPVFETKSTIPLMLRPHLGGALNLAGRTSHLHAGMTLTLDLTKSVFAEISLGGALHNGRIGHASAPNRARLGCTAQFREAFGIGYRLDARWSVVASAEHLSNGGLCRNNRGLTNLGVEVGYRF